LAEWTKAMGLPAREMFQVFLFVNKMFSIVIAPKIYIGWFYYLYIYRHRYYFEMIVDNLRAGPGGTYL
jgi:hypothetical protein